MEYDVIEAGLATVVDRGQSGDGFAHELALLDQAQVAAFFGSEGAAVGEEGEGVGLIEFRDPGIDAERMELAGRGDRFDGLGEVGLVALMLGAFFAHINDHGADLLVVDGGAPSGHAFFGKAVADAAGEAGVIAAVDPHIVEHRRSRAALHVLAVAAGAEGGVTLGDGAGAFADALGGERRGEEGEEGSGEGQAEAWGVSHRSEMERERNRCATLRRRETKEIPTPAKARDRASRLQRI